MTKGGEVKAGLDLSAPKKVSSRRGGSSRKRRGRLAGGEIRVTHFR